LGAHFGKTDMIIRDPAPADLQQWLGLWQQYLTFYKVDLAPQITGFTWTRLLSALKMRLAVAGDDIVGFAIHHHHCSTWIMGDDCYLEDLFVAETARKMGVGRALIDDLAAIAKNRGWKRVYWHTDGENATARRLYDTYVESDGHVRYRLAIE
jgi:GNAT superfamily N-acetyltransferase